MRETHILPIAILVTLIAFIAQGWLGQQHPVVPATAPATEFSGERGMDLLKEFLAENVPHPIGSEENRVVKRRIQAWLDEQGFEHEEQQQWGCSERWTVTCGRVENIIATVPGIADGPYVALMAHYDSVLFAPGAGDDMAGVVSVLETARAVRELGPLRHPLLLIITDGEETGLHGAEAFFRHHPLASEVAVLLNVEGSGTRGYSQVLRTTESNAWFMELFRRSASQPFGSSLGNEVFKRMPNDTDFSVSMEAGVPGIDFAFAGERNHYHTPNDNAENLDPRTIQHHGDNLMPLVVRLANWDLPWQYQGDVVYNESYGVWFQWPAEWSPLLLGLTGFLLLIASLRSGTGVLRLVLVSTVVPLAILAAGGLLTHGSFALLEAINGATVSWPANLWPYRVVVFTSTILPALLLARWLAARFSLEVLLLGGWWFFWWLTLLLLVYLSGAASVFLVLLVPASTLLALAAWFPGPDSVRTGLRLATLLPASITLAITGLIEDTQGYRLLVTIWPWIALFAVTCLAFARGAWLARVTTATAVLLVAGLIAGSVVPLYSEFRPQHVNLRYVESADGGEALMRVLTSGTVPEAMRAVIGYDEAERLYVPWDPDGRLRVATVESAGLSAPALEVERNLTTLQGREVTLNLSSQRGAWRLALHLPPESKPLSAVVEGVEMSLAPDDSEEDPGYTSLYFYGVQSQNPRLTLRFGSTAPIDAYLDDATPVLPAVAQPALESRPDYAAPVHRGDLATVYTQVTF